MTSANAITSMNRAVGTVIGCVYSVIVAYIVDGWDVVRASVFIFFAVVLFQLPCTYVRTIALYGYTGTVAAFTASILLLFPTIDIQQAVDRIIDTYVGVFVFLIVEFVVAPLYSDDAFIDDIYSVFKGIQEHFRNFIDVFQSETAGNTKSPTKSSLISYISHGRQVSLYSSQIPLPWRPPALESRIVDELMNGQDAAHRSIQGMLWAIRVCRRNENEEFSYLLKPLKSQLDKVAIFVDMVSSYLQSNANHMRDWRKLQDQASGCSADTLINGQYHANVFSNKLTLLSTGDEESEEMREFFAQIEVLIRNLQDSYRESSAIGSIKTARASPVISRQSSLVADIISAEEVKTVNSVLACMKDLVDALRLIAASMTRLRAFRDIRLTQNGCRKVG